MTGPGATTTLAVAPGQDIGDCDSGRQISFTAVAGTTYNVAVDALPTRVQLMPRTGVLQARKRLPSGRSLALITGSAPDE